MTPNSTAMRSTAKPLASAELGLSIPALEQVYDCLASAIDEVGDDHTALFLVKLALLNAQALGDADVFEAHIRTAMLDLTPHSTPSTHSR
jgi:hypothetical protein